MKKRRVGPLLLLAIFLGAGAYTVFQLTRADRFDQAFGTLLESTSTRIFDAANQRDKAADLFTWMQGEGLQQLESLPPGPEKWQQRLHDRLRALFVGAGEMFSKDPLQATSGDTLQSIYLEVQEISTALGQARDNPAQF